MGVPRVVCAATATLRRIRLLKAPEGLEVGKKYVGSVCTTPDMVNGYLVLRDAGTPVFVPKAHTVWVDQEFFDGLERPDQQR